MNECNKKIRAYEVTAAVLWHLHFNKKCYVPIFGRKS